MSCRRAPLPTQNATNVWKSARLQHWVHGSCRHTSGVVVAMAVAVDVAVVWTLRVIYDS
jgi:hypothetical protein